ncbi:MAG: phosphoribosylamine--glycine ligase [Flavobacteriaceae bacterium]|nr:phosphoribosylamine--glycine ligase [Flavobacteriaceae bacterium]
MNIAVLGSGGREHALSWKFAQKWGWDQVFTLPGNGGIPNSHKVDINDFEAVRGFCEAHAIELIFVGPEDPLANGIVNYFREKTDIKVFGPDKTAAQLEGSKIFAKEFMKKHGVVTADFKSFQSLEGAHEYATSKKGNLVIKYDGLAAGKGVFVCDNMEEVEIALDELQEKYGKAFPFLMEDKIVGKEISIIGFTDGQNIRLLLPSQDHKQLLEGDLGPNTGGMGAFCPVPFYNETLKKAIQENAIIPTINGLKAEGFDYKGVIYFGLMIGENGPEVLEYNVRLGDPETEVILPSLKTDLSDLVLACLNGSLSDLELEFNKGYFVDVVMVSGGYPKAYQKGFPIYGLDQVEKGTLIFHAGTKAENEVIKTNGGRVINVVTQAPTLEEAIQNTYKEVAKISFEGHFYRKDIGRRSN